MSRFFRGRVSFAHTFAAKWCASAGKVVEAIPQRRQNDLKNVQPVIKVLPKQPFSDAVFEVDVRGGDHPDIEADPFVAAQPLDLFLLEHSQQFRLHRKRHIADLIKKNRPVVRRFEFPHAPLHGSGERPFDVPEQFGLEQGLGNGAAIHGYPRTSRPVPAPMNFLRNNFFACARFPLDENIAAAVRNQTDAR